MLMLIALWWLFILQIKTCGAMVKDLNFHNEGERFMLSLL
jgi:hypothetical protein